MSSEVPMIFFIASSPICSATGHEIWIILRPADSPETWNFFFITGAPYRAYRNYSPLST
jgi:hypothetical protein